MIGRADTCRTMVSRTASTPELGRALSHILMDADAKLPDDVEELEVPSVQNHRCLSFIPSLFKLMYDRFGVIGV